MNILIANTQEFNPQIGGVEKISNDLTKSFIKLGHNVFFVSCLHSKYSKDYVTEAPQLILPSSLYLDDENVKAFSKYIIDNKIEVILNQAGNILEFTKLCSISIGNNEIPLISAVHTNPLNALIALRDFKFSKLNKNKIKPFLRMLLYPYRYFKILKSERNKYIEVAKASDKIVLLSNQFLAELQYYIGNKYDDKIIAIPNFTDKPKANLATNKEKVILFVGRLDFGQKRPDRIIEMWGKFYKKYPDWSLRIAGDGPDKNKLINYVAKQNIKNVNFLGFCDVDNEYKKAEILCMTSTIEGLPMVLIEGSMFGCISIAFDSFKSVYDIIESGKNGYIIPSYNKNKYIKVLKNLIENSELRDSLRKETLKINENFDKKPIVEKWIRLFNEVTK